MAAKRHVVTVLALEPVIGYDLAIPPAVFGAAADDNGNPYYDVRICSVDGAPVASPAGYAIVPGHDATALAEADTVIVPGTRIPGPRREGVLSDEVAEALGRIRPGTRLMSICTGAFVLAAAGVLDDRPATTHWGYANDFRALYPAVHLDEDALFVDDGDVLTSAGLSAGMDLCLHVLRLDHGSTVVNQVARHLVVPPWRDGGQSQFIEHGVPDAGSTGTAPAREWALRNLAEDVDLTTLAAQARMSVRTFSRRFKAETGMSPGAWLLQQRLRHARRLLETTDFSVDRVATAAGLGSAASLRHHMRTEIGVSPLAYRKTFRAGA